MSGSLVLALLDSRDFVIAFFANRKSEEIGLGIEGLQLFHFFMVGMAISAVGGSFLAMKRDERSPIDSISPDSYGPSILPQATMKRPEADPVNSMTRSDEESDHDLRVFSDLLHIVRS